MPAMTALCDHDVDSFSRELRELGHNSDHAQLVLRAFYGSGGNLCVDRMPIAKPLRREITQPNRLMQSRILSRQIATDGTVKLLIGFADGASIESVFMPSHRPDRSAGCVSSQVGCAMGCD